MARPDEKAPATASRRGLVRRAIGSANFHLLRPARERAGAALRRRRNAARAFQPLFVTGAAGSGTTLLAFLLAERFDCAGVVTESARQISKLSCLYIPAIDSHASLADFEAALEPEPAWSVDEARASLTDLYRASAVARADVIVDKAPNVNLVRTAFVQRCFPGRPLLAIFRDPVANLEGLRRKWQLFGRTPLDELVDFYRRIHEAFLGHVDAHPEGVLLLEYERLVGDQAGLLTALGSQLGLAPARGVHRIEERANVAGRGVRNVRENRIEVVQDANRGAYARLEEDEIERIRSRLGDLHGELRARSLTPQAAGAGDAAPGPGEAGSHS